MTLEPFPRMQLIPVDQLRPHDRNPRSITRERLEALKHTLLAEPELLEARPLIALPNGMVIAGNMRQRALEALFEESNETFLRQWPEGAVPTLVRDLDDDQARRWMLLDNNPFGEWEDQALAELIYEHEQGGSDLSTLGFTDERLTQLLDSVDGRKGPNRWPDEPAPPAPDVGRAKRGTIYKLGRHRLMCGDATSGKHVAKLLAGAKPKLMVTDPPYGVELQRDGADAMLNDDRVDWSPAFALVPSLDIAYVWHAGTFGHHVAAGLERIGFVVAQQIVWDKIAFALGRSDYQWQHETALYAAAVGAEVPWYGPVHEPGIYARRAGSGRVWLGDRAQTTIWSAPSPKRNLAGSEDAVDHPTQKPTLLWTRPIQNHTLRGEAVYEPFCGSGTAIIAAEMTGRTCYAMELDPRFVDVAKERYRLFVEEGTTP